MGDLARLEQPADDSGLQSDQLDKYLTFHLGAEDFGIPIHHVTEIIGIQAITQVPDMPGDIRGVINLRGKVIPVMDVRLRFGMPNRQYDERTCIIVVEVADRQVGLIVDQVNEVIDIPPEQVEPSHNIGSDKGSYIQGLGKVGEKVKMLLEVNYLLNTKIAAAGDPGGSMG